MCDYLIDYLPFYFEVLVGPERNHPLFGLFVTHTLALLPKGKKAGILLWGFGGEVRGDGQGGDGRCSRSNYTDGNFC